MAGGDRLPGYDPGPEPETLTERIKATRQKQGISQRELARRLGIDPSTVMARGNGTVKKPFPRFRQLFEKYVKSAWRSANSRTSWGCFVLTKMETPFSGPRTVAVTTIAATAQIANGAPAPPAVA